MLYKQQQQQQPEQQQLEGKEQVIQYTNQGEVDLLQLDLFIEVEEMPPPRSSLRKRGRDGEVEENLK